MDIQVDFFENIDIAILLSLRRSSCLDRFWNTLHTEKVQSFCLVWQLKLQVQEQIEEDCKNDKSNCGGGGGGEGPWETVTHIYSERTRRRARRLLADSSHRLSGLFQLSLALLTQQSDSSASLMVFKLLAYAYCIALSALFVF